MRGVLLTVALSCHATVGFGQQSFTSASAIAHDGTTIPIEIYGSARRAILLGPGTAPAGARALQQGFVDALGDGYRLIFISYPTEPKMYTLTPAAVARDFLAIAEAAGVDHFAYYGYSWGCVTGLQLALRTDRLTALACGGFPVLGGPYAEMLALTRLMESGPQVFGGVTVPHLPENARQFVTYYEGLRSFDDGAIQSRLTIPRLNFAGSADDISVNDTLVTRIGQTVIERRAELTALGWDVEIVEGKDHGATMVSGIAAIMVRRWLDRRWPQSPRQ